MRAVWEWFVVAILGGVLATIGAVVMLVMLLAALWPAALAAAAIVYLWRAFA